MLPLSVIACCGNRSVLVELKSGESYNGTLVKNDRMMNIVLKDVVVTSPDGDRFWKMEQCFIKGTSVRFIRIPDDIVKRYG